MVVMSFPILPYLPNPTAIFSSHLKPHLIAVVSCSINAATRFLSLSKTLVVEVVARSTKAIGMFFSLLNTHVVLVAVGSRKATAITNLILHGGILLLCLVFFPGPTLTLLYYLAFACFYFCVGIVGLLCLAFNYLFKLLCFIWDCLLPTCFSPNYSENQRNNVYGDRQKMKESDEYKRAMAAEWAARQQELRRQAEEARRQRTSKKSESKRSKANDQASRRKEEERLNNEKDRIHEELRPKLMRLQQCGDMASLLRSLGIHLPSNPTSKQIRAAYREACKKFHPDKLARADLRHQIEAEEKFKLISAMKDNCSSF